MSNSTTHPPIYEPCEGCGELLDVTTFSPFEKAICPLCSAETHVKREFDSYLLERRYAVGGMSVIFVGRDKTLDRKVAIKVLNEEYCNDEIRIQAFENEARLTAQVSHPNVVKVYAVGRAYGRFYLVMELLEGRTFESIMSKRGTLPEEEVLKIAAQVASGLQAAKDAGMIHRDVKPGNILVDHEGHARLVDFGLALITQDGSAQADEVWATPYYVPPEALERGIEDFRSDIYAFGATLYHALAGRAPFETTSTSNKVLRSAKQTIPRLCKVAPWVSPNTGEVIDRMMAFKPEDRWGSYRQVLKALRHATRTIGEQAPPNPVPQTQTRNQRRKKKNILGIGLILAALALSALFLFWQPWKTKPNEEPDTLPSIVSGEDQEPTFNPNGPDWQSARLAVSKKEHAKARASFIALSKNAKLSHSERAWASFEASISALLEGQPATARALASDSLSHIKQTDHSPPFTAALRSFNQALQKIPPLASRDFPDNTTTLPAAMGTFALALKQWEQGQWQASLPSFARVRSANLPSEFEWFNTYQNLADSYLADGQILSKTQTLPAPKNATEASELIAQISDRTKKLRTSGRARYNLRAHRAYLARLRKSFQTPTPEAQPTDWKGARSALARQGQLYQFGKLAQLLASPPADSPAEALWSWRLLHKGATSFITDLSNQSDWSAKNKDGTDITPHFLDRNGITLEDGTLIPWNQIDRQSLLAAHTGKEPHCIAFAWLIGMTTFAEDKAENLAESDPQFRNTWKRILVGISL